MKGKRTPRFRLLPYQALAKHWMGPALWLVPGGIVLWWAVPRLSQLDQRYAPAGLVVAIAGALIVAYASLARRAHISCHKNNFVVHTPLYPVAFSYFSFR
jgi:hypothetical protein